MEKEFNVFEYISNKLGGKAKKIICCCFPCQDVHCESWYSGVQDPRTAVLVEYAKVDKSSGDIHWTEFADLLDEEQRAAIERSAMKYRK